MLNNLFSLSNQKQIGYEKTITMLMLAAMSFGTFTPTYALIQTQTPAPTTKHLKKMVPR